MVSRRRQICPPGENWAGLTACSPCSPPIFPRSFPQKFRFISGSTQHCSVTHCHCDPLSSTHTPNPLDMSCFVRLVRGQFLDANTKTCWELCHQNICAVPRTFLKNMFCDGCLGCCDTIQSRRQRVHTQSCLCHDVCDGDTCHPCAS